MVYLALWQMETTFQEARRQLGMETQMLGLFSMQVVRQAAWYRKSRPTFSDALALVR